jgi:hypothetical protein
MICPVHGDECEMVCGVAADLEELLLRKKIDEQAREIEKLTESGQYLARIRQELEAKLFEQAARIEILEQIP